MEYLGTVTNNKDIASKEYADTKAPVSHATSATTYGTGSGSNYGHVQLSDSTSSTSNTSAGIAATPKAVKDALDAAKTYTDGKAGATVTLNTWVATV